MATTEIIKEKKESKIQTTDFSLLHSISSILTSSLNLKDTLYQIFENLESYLGVTRGTVTLKNSVTDDLHLETAYGLTEEERKVELNNLPIDISFEVFDTGKPIIVKKIEENPNIIKKITKRKITKDISFICLPITLSQEKIGTISIDLPYKNDETLDENVKLLSVFSLLIAQEIKLKQLLEFEKKELINENLKLKNEIKDKYNIDNIIGSSSSMVQVYENIIQVANSNATVIIRGESGTGKELVAHAIHYNSPRAKGPFIRINCGAIPESLIESELFGYEKGAFTDAQDQKVGKFEAAHNGTIFLDEIGELSTNIQVKLLRVLQEREFHRVGSSTPIKINVRVITATNRNLEKELEEKRFRHDLYYRLNVFPIFIPPLRERKTDIMLLAEFFLSKFAKENNKKIKRISGLAIDLLNSYHWPGNVRELENCLERAVLLCKSETIHANDLPPTLQRIDSDNQSDEDIDKNISLRQMIENFEREIIIDVLKKTKGNKSKAAKYLQTTQRILGYKIQNLNIKHTK